MTRGLSADSLACALPALQPVTVLCRYPALVSPYAPIRCECNNCRTRSNLRALHRWSAEHPAEKSPTTVRRQPLFFPRYIRRGGLLTRIIHENETRSWDSLHRVL